METLTIIFLVFLFLAIYFFVFFVVVFAHNSRKMFYSPEPKKKYAVSFLVPSYNEEDTIENTINSIYESSYPIKEVIVINDGSSDDTSKIVRNLCNKYKSLKLIDKKNSGKADSLNQGIKIAKGELIAVVDADSYPEKNAVGKMVGFFDDNKIGAVTSCVLLKNKKTFFEKIQEMEYIALAWTRKLFDFIDSVYVTNGPLSIYRKNVLEEIRGFDIHSITEDIEITWHILSKGYKTRMSLSSVVYTSVPNKFRAWWGQRVRWGIGGIETIFKYRRFFFKKGMFGMFVMPFVALTIFLSILGFIFGIYLMYRNIVSKFVYVDYSISLQSTLLRPENFNFNPTIILIMIAILFIISFSYTSYIYIKMEQKHILKFRKVFNRLFYMIIYLTFYPVVWFDAIYRVIKKEHKW